MLTDLHHFIRDFNWGAENTASLVIGLLLGVAAMAMATWWWRKLFGTRGDQVTKKELQEELGKSKLLKELLGERDLQIRQLDDALKAKDEQIQAITLDCEALKDDAGQIEQTRDKFRQLNDTHKANLLKANASIRMLNARNASLRHQLQASAAHIQAIVDLDGKFWEKPPAGDVPAFRELQPGRPPIIALVNLKGGVGKTTITAHLGATLWQAGKRTLLADLDNQGSLTALCLSASQLQDVRRGGGRFVQRLLQDGAASPDNAWNNLTRLDDTEGWLLAADEHLADVEEHARAKWLLQPGPRDVRYLLRDVLHAPLLQERFDAMLLDCPPRLSTACINALTCCDYVLIPVLLDKTSADAVPRLLKWLRLLKTSGICPDLQVLGVLANCTSFQNKLTKRETNLWQKLTDRCRDAWAGPVHLFERHIPDKARFAEAADSRRLAGLDDELKPIFKDLLAEIQRRSVFDDRRRPASIRA